MLVVLLRSAILYVTLVIFIRMMGKRQISQMQPFEVVITIMVADLAASPMEDMGIPLIQGVIPLIALLVLHNLFDLLCQKSILMRKLICGSPSVVIRNGVLNQDELEKLNINMSDLMENLRSSGHMDIEQVMYCVIETNGTVSVLPKATSCPAAQGERKEEDPSMVYTVVYEGKTDENNLQRLAVTKAILEKNLRRLGFCGSRGIYVAMLDERDKLFVQESQTGRTCTARLERMETP